MARRPRWIAALVFVLLLAAIFAALSQWQLSRSISTGTVEKRATETVEPLVSVAKPQHPVTSDASGQIVSARGSWVAGDYLLLSDRLQRDTTGWWVVGHFTTVGDAGLAIAVGWSPNRAGAEKALATIEADPPGGVVTVTGRYYPAEGPQDSDFEHGKLSTLAPATLVNLWKNADPAGTYGGYAVASKASAGLTTIYSPKPSSAVEVNLLNIFYAIEWIVFAGFAFFLWYRLVKDAVERELDELEEAAMEQATLEASGRSAEVN
ncbi:hypothetical protein BH09ACT1_BH09ACT1_27300 [soil metagenome]